MALTGLTWSFQWYRTGFYKTFGVEVQPSMGHGNAAANATAKGGKRDGKPEGREGRGAHRYSPYTNWQQVYEQLAEANPDYKQISVSDGSASVAVPRFGNHGEQTVISSIPVMARLPKLLSIRTWITPAKSVAGFTPCMWAVGAVC
jgi:hypothetical protein